MSITGCLKKIKTEVCFFINTIEYIIPFIFTTFLSYFYFCSHISIGIDDLTSPRYLAGELLRQGRITGQIINCLMPFDSIECIYNIVGIFLYSFSAMLICCLFRTILNMGESVRPYSIFSCIFISYPIIIDIFPYHGLPFAIGGNTILIVIIIFFIYNKIKYSFLISTALMIFACSWHEGELPVYICLVFFILLLELLKEKISFYDIIKKGMSYAVPLMLGMALYFASCKAILLLTQMEKSRIGGNVIAYGQNGIIECFDNIFSQIKQEIILKIGNYLPIGLLVICVLILASIGIHLFIIHRKWLILLTVFGMNFSLISLTLVQGTLMPYRASQVYTFYVASVLFLLALLLDKINWLKNMYSIGIFVLVVNQIIVLNKAFELDVRRSDNELAVVRQIGYDIQTQYGTDKPVVFTGCFSIGEEISNCLYLDPEDSWILFLDSIADFDDVGDGTHVYPIHQTFCNSVISWGISAFNEINTELLRLFAYCGYDFQQGTEEMYQDALNNNMIDERNQIQIIECDEYILVHFN